MGLIHGLFVSMAEVEVNEPMCGASSGRQQMVGVSGHKHDVFVVHKSDGSVWLRFGVDGKENNWTFVSNFGLNVVTFVSNFGLNVVTFVSNFGE